MVERERQGWERKIERDKSGRERERKIGRETGWEKERERTISRETEVGETEREREKERHGGREKDRNR